MKALMLVAVFAAGELFAPRWKWWHWPDKPDAGQVDAGPSDGGSTGPHTSPVF